MDILIATPLFLGGIGLPEILVILVIILLFFGAKKIPELMKGLGKGVKSFKEVTRLPTRIRKTAGRTPKRTDLQT